MAGHPAPHFQNTDGHAFIEIGVKEFKCMGTTPPLDHPHIYLDMGDDTEIVCPYCSTLYRFNPSLPEDQTIPPGCLHSDEQV